MCSDVMWSGRANLVIYDLQLHSSAVFFKYFGFSTNAV